MSASAALLALAVPCLAQRTPATIPTVLAMALFAEFSSISGEQARFVLDRAPDGWPKALLPAAPARLVGGTIIGPMRAVVFSVPRATDWRASSAAALTRAGFRRVAAPSAHGFVNETATRDRYCADSSSAMALEVDSSASLRWIAITLTSAGRGTGCVGSAQGRGEGIPDPALRIPALPAPTGVDVRPSGSSWSDKSVEIGARMDTTLSAAAALAHYSGVLTAAGWRAVGSPVLSGGVGVQELSATDERKQEWQGTLLLLTTGNQRELSLRMALPGVPHGSAGNLR